jgi:hypothetical protein
MELSLIGKMRGLTIVRISNYAEVGSIIMLDETALGEELPIWVADEARRCRR